LRGEPINTTKRLVQAVTGYTEEFTAQQRQRIYQDLAKALTQSRGQDAQIALRALDAAMQGQRLTDAQTDMLARLVSSALATSMAPSAGRATATQYGQ
jgi:ribosomal protein L18E